MISTRQRRCALVALAMAAALAAPGTALAAGGRPPGAGGGRGGGETTIGNNLSNPVVFVSNVGILGLPISAGQDAPWADPNTGLRMPPTAVGEYTQPETFALPTGSITVWPQGKSGNSWQASWLANGTGSSYGTIANWGDNILGSNGKVKAFALSTAIRIEVKLTPDGTSMPDLGGGSYQPMVNNGLTGTAEKWAASVDHLQPISSGGTVIPTVFTGGAILTVTPVSGPDGAVSSGDPLLTKRVSETFVPADAEGSGSPHGTAPIRLAGELNASGNVVYGMNLFPQQVVGMTAGYYRITFSIEPTFQDNALPTPASLESYATLAGVDPADASASTEGGVTPALAAANGRAWFDSANESTSVVIQITSSTTGGRGGGGGGRGGGGGGGH